tara:strand:- start:17325 stop:17891 length:567 start_codon:yes stop_codon:yes gene_type:complete
MLNVKNDSGIDKTHQATSQDFSSPHILDLTDAQEAIIEAARKETCEDFDHYTFSANESTGLLEIDVVAAPIVWEWSFTEFISDFLTNKLKGHFKNIDVNMFYGTQNVNGLPSYQNMAPIESSKVVFLMYQLDEIGEVQDEAHDIELIVHWHKSMTKTNDYKLIEQLFERLAELDFTLEELEQRLAQIN